MLMTAERSANLQPSYLWASSRTRMCSTCRARTEGQSVSFRKRSLWQTTYHRPACSLLRDDQASFDRSQFCPQIAVDLVEVGQDEMLLHYLRFEFGLFGRLCRDRRLLLLEARSVRFDLAQCCFAVSSIGDCAVFERLTIETKLSKLLVELFSFAQGDFGGLRPDELDR